MVAGSGSSFTFRLSLIRLKVSAIKEAGVSVYDLREGPEALATNCQFISLMLDKGSMEHKRAALVCVRCFRSTRANGSQTYDRSAEGQTLKVDSSRDLGTEKPHRVIVCGLSGVMRKRQSCQHARQHQRT